MSFILLPARLFSAAFFFLGLSTGFVVAQNGAVLTGIAVGLPEREPLPGAAIALLNPADSSLVKGTMTDSLGRFTLSGARAGTYLLKTGYVACLTLYRTLEIPPAADSLRLDTLFLQADTSIAAIEITDYRKMVSFTADGLTLDVSPRMAQAANTLLDLLRRTPMLSVTPDGDVNIQGARSTTLQINGRPSALTDHLQQIPAAAVQQIRVILTPGARYDAQGQGGIVDIRLKRNRLVGLTGSVYASAGTAPSNSGMLYLNYGRPKFSLTGYANTHTGRSRSWSEQQRYFLPENTPSLLGDGKSTGKSQWNGANLQADWFPDTLNALTVEGSRYISTSNSQSGANTSVFDTSTALLWRTLRTTGYHEQDYSNNLASAYTRNFKKQKEQEFTASLNYSDSRSHAHTDLGTHYFDALGLDDTSRTVAQRNGQNEDTQTMVGQADYVHPLAKKTKLETGYRYAYRRISTDTRQNDDTSHTGNYIANPVGTNLFRYNENVHAGYVSLKHKWAKLSSVLGLRTEMASIQTALLTTGEAHNRQMLNLFPNAQFRYTLTDKHALTASYSRRIDRPRGYSLNPFVSIADSFNQRTGNPRLRPEFTHNASIGYQYLGQKHQLTLAAFGLYTLGDISTVTQLLENRVALSRPENLNTSYSYGLRINSMLRIGDFSVNTALTPSQTGYVQKKGGSTTSNAGLTLSGNLNLEWELPKGFDLMLMTYFNTPSISLQGRSRPYVYMYFYVGKDFLDEKLTLQLIAEDPFYLLRSGNNTTTADFHQLSKSRSNSRQLRLGVNWEFGRVREAPQRRRPQTQKHDDAPRQGN